MDPEADRLLDALEAAHPDAPVSLVTTKVAWDEGGPDPLDVIGYVQLDEPFPHFHAVGYGLSRAGHGFELSTRVRRERAEEQLPNWVFGWLQNQARYVMESGQALRPGDQKPANGPIRRGADTALTAMLYRVDPVLDPLAEPEIVQVVAVTDGELRAKRTWQFEAIVDPLERHLGPELIADLDRPSLLDDPAVAAEVAEGARRDGSSTGRIMAWGVEVDPDRPRVTVDAVVAQDLGLMVAARLGHGRELDIHDADGAVLHLVPADRVALEPSGEGHWGVELTPDAVRWLDAHLVPRAGVYTSAALAPLEIEVRAVDITDRDGNVVGRRGD